MNIEKIDNSELSNFFDELEHFCYIQKNKQLFTFGQNKISRMSFCETFRSTAFYEFSNKTLSDFLTSKLEGMNLYSPVSASFLPYLVLEHYKNSSFNLNDEIVKKVENPKKEDIIKIINFCFKDSSLIDSDTAINIFENNGFLSEFLIKPSLTNKNAVLHTSGLDVPCDNFSGYFETKNYIELSDCIVLLYDGFIQNVSELNKILSISNSSNQKFLLICPGASMDVLNTCAVNMEANKAFVMISTPKSETWIEAFEGLQEEFSIYGAASGRLLNNFDIEENAYYNCRVSSGSLHVKNIDSSGINKANTEIYLRSEDWESRGIITDQVNYLKSLLQQLATCGVIDVEALLDFNVDLKSTFPEIPKKVPAFAVCRSIKEAQKFVSQILKTSCVVRIKS